MALSWLLSLLLAVAPMQDAAPQEDAAYRAALVASIHRFAADGELDHLRALLAKHAPLINARQMFREPHKPRRTDGFTALHHAAEQGREAVVAFLLERGADVNRADGGGWTPLHLAAQNGHLAVVKRLVARGASLEARTRAVAEGYAPGGAADAPARKLPAIAAWTAVQLAEASGQRAVVEFLRTVRQPAGEPAPH